MKYTEFLIEITKAFNDKNNAVILQLVVNEPFRAYKSLLENKTLQENYIQHAKKDSFFKEVFAAGRHPHIGELTSKPAHMVPLIMAEREFVVYSSEKMHAVSDFLKATKIDPGMVQVKNINTFDDVSLIDACKRNRNVTDFLNINTNNDKTTKELALKNPVIKIMNHKDVLKVSEREVLEMLEQFDNTKNDVTKVKKEQVKPLWEKHKMLIKNNPKIPEDAIFETIINYNLSAVQAEERELLLEEYKKIENIKYKKCKIIN